jgi:TAG lipase / steryl ester hydrolase / phospholipase A2 / LPA acyltransferase
MTLLYGPRWHSGSEPQDDWSSARSPKRQKTSGLASILRPITSAVKSPLDTLGSLAESLQHDLGPPRLSPEEQERQIQLSRLENARTRDEWEAAAWALDDIEGGEDWKETDACDLYDVDLVKSRLRQLKSAKDREDLPAMRFLVRNALTRDLGGMGHVDLYSRSRIGTKRLIHEYIETARDVVDYIAATNFADPADRRELHKEMKEARQSFGRTALCLSGGGTYGMNHIGVVKALFDAKLLPRLISGASAGSIVAAVLCTRIDDEIPQVLTEFCHGDLDVFEKAGAGSSWCPWLLRKAARIFAGNPLYDIDNLKRVMKGLLGDITFQEAYYKTRRILNVCVTSAGVHEKPRLLNYHTSPDVTIWSAVAASCSVPLIYSAARLMAKSSSGEIEPWAEDDTTTWIDGSVDSDLPMTKMAEMYNVNHFIVSQVNPHVIPFLSETKEEGAPGEMATTSVVPSGPSWVETLLQLAKSEALHRLQFIAELDTFPSEGFMNPVNKMGSILGQRYSGDITIIPDIPFTQILRVLKNPDPDFMDKAVETGEHATWPKLSRIKNHLTVEFALDNAVRDTVERVTFSQSQTDLRSSAFDKPTYKSRVRKQRPGSSRSHLSAWSQTSNPVARQTIGRQGAHRPIRSMVEPLPTTAHSLHEPVIKVPGPSDDDFSDTSSISSGSPYPLSNEEHDGIPDEISMTSGSPPAAETGHVYAASQPVTPSIASKAFNSDSSSSTPTSNTPKAPAPPGLAMTPIPLQRPSSPEQKYKKLFHGTRSPLPTINSQASTPEAKDESSFSKRLGKFGLNIDLSGSKPSSQKRKRSMSTGLKSLRPPERR